MSIQTSDLNALGIDPAVINRELDKVKSQVFLGTNAAFLGSLLCSVEFVWGECGTAATNGIHLWWDPRFFMKSSTKLRKATLIHELWHIGRLHFMRIGMRDPEIWNEACDYIINQDMEAEGFEFEGFPALSNKAYKGMGEEELYDKLYSNSSMRIPNPMKDMMPVTDAQKATVVGNVVSAVHQATITGQAGSLPGAIKKTLDKFLNPIVPWERLLHSWFSDLGGKHHTWRRPNRRYLPHGMYMPGMEPDEDKLDHLIYFIDVSGSISNMDALRFNSEVKAVKEQYQPRKMTLVQFDTMIQDVKVIEEDEDFDKIEITRGGGTSLACVADYIDEAQATAAIIFSDLYCDHMRQPINNIPILWVVLGHKGATVNFGKKIHINH